jgi:hypothetical protein
VKTPACAKTTENAPADQHVVSEGKMSIKNNPRFQNILYRTIQLTLALVLIGAGGLTAARAEGSGQFSGITLVPGTVPVSDAMAGAAVTALEGGLSSYPNLHYFAVTDVRDMDPWMLISFVGLETYDSAAGWKLEDGGWFGLVLLKDGGRGNWAGAASFRPSNFRRRRR